MNQNITLSVDQQLLRKVRSFAAQRGTSISAMLAEELRKVVEDDEAYLSARARATAQLRAPFRLGGGKIASRDSLHEGPVGN